MENSELDRHDSEDQPRRGEQEPGTLADNATVVAGGGTEDEFRQQFVQPSEPVSEYHTAVDYINDLIDQLKGPEPSGGGMNSKGQAANQAPVQDTRQPDRQDASANDSRPAARPPGPGSRPNKASLSDASRRSTEPVAPDNHASNTIVLGDIDSRREPGAIRAPAGPTATMIIEEFEKSNRSSKLIAPEAAGLPSPSVLQERVQEVKGDGSVREAVDQLLDRRRSSMLEMREAAHLANHAFIRLYDCISRTRRAYCVGGIGCFLAMSSLVGFAMSDQVTGYAFIASTILLFASLGLFLMFFVLVQSVIKQVGLFHLAKQQEDVEIAELTPET